MQTLPDWFLDYFPQLDEQQKVRFSKLKEQYSFWNEQINVISRKDIENLYERHVLHSLTITQFFPFNATDRVLDIGTGGGFPGIPLAIYYPETQFHLIDSIAKKIKVVNSICKALEIRNVTASHMNAVNVKNQYDWIVSRAVAPLSKLVSWSQKLIDPKEHGSKGLLCLKGGDLTEEISKVHFPVEKIALNKKFQIPYFEEKYIIYVRFK